MDSPEYKTLSQCYPKLVSCLEQSPNHVADQLRPSGILAPETLSTLGNIHAENDQKARKISDAALEQVKINPKLFYKFVSALEAAGTWTETVVNELKVTHFSYLATKQTVSLHTPIRVNTDSTLSPENEDSVNQTLIPTRIESESQDENNLYKEAKAMPAVGASDRIFDKSEADLERETRSMRRKFASLIINSIKKASVEVKALATYLQQIEPIEASLVTAKLSCLFFTTKIIQSIENSDVDNVFRELKDYYSWFNYDLIEGIIDAFCDKDDDLKMELSDYKENMKQYCENRLCQFPDSLNGFGEHRDNNKPYIFKIDKEWSLMRLSELDAIKSIICDVLKLKRVALFLRSVENGCVEVTFDIPQHVADIVFPPSRDQVDTLKKHGIQYCDSKLHCDSLTDYFSIPKLLQLHKYGINLIEVLSKDQYYFHVTSGVQLLENDKQKALVLTPEAYVELILNAWERSKQPTYPPTWEGLFTVLRKMDLGHLVEQIAKCVTGSVPEIEDSPQTSEPEGPPGEKDVREEVDILDLRAEVKQLKTENDSLTQDNDLLTDDIEHLTKVNEQLRAENDLLRAKSQSWSPQIKQEPTPFKDEPESGVDNQVSTSAAHQHTAVKSEPQESLEIPYLPGVEVVGRTSVVVTNSGQSFYWSGYGFKLHSPPGSLPSGVDQCVLQIYASLAGQYQLPDNVVLVSAVFWVRCDPPCRFQQKMTIELQHCAKMTSSTKLTFVRAVCSQESLPYTFKKLEHGSFSEQSLYGSRELDDFSGVSVAGEDVERLYTASLYYLGSEAHSREIHFVVNLDTEAHKTLVMEEYPPKRAVLGVNHPVEFEDDRLALDIPMTGTKVKGWKIFPLFPPTVIKKHVDQFKPGQRIPHCHLKAEVASKHKKTVSKVFYQVRLVGAKEPFNVVTFDLDPQFKQPVAASGDLIRAIAQEHRQERISIPPTITELQQVGEISKENSSQEPNVELSSSYSARIETPYPRIELPPSIHNTLYTAAFSARCVWKCLGLALNISDTDLTAIELNKKKVEDCFSEMLIQWLQSRNNCYLDFFLQALSLPQVNQAELCTPVEAAVLRELWNERTGRKRPLTNILYGEPRSKQPRES